MDNHFHQKTKREPQPSESTQCNTASKTLILRYTLVIDTLVIDTTMFPPPPTILMPEFKISAGKTRRL